MSYFAVRGRSWSVVAHVFVEFALFTALRGALNLGVPVFLYKEAKRFLSVPRSVGDPCVLLFFIVLLRTLESAFTFLDLVVVRPLDAERISFCVSWCCCYRVPGVCSVSGDSVATYDCSRLCGLSVEGYGT